MIAWDSVNPFNEEELTVNEPVLPTNQNNSNPDSTESTKIRIEEGQTAIHRPATGTTLEGEMWHMKRSASMSIWETIYERTVDQDELRKKRNEILPKSTFEFTYISSCSPIFY